MPKICKKCGYERQEIESVSEYECPKCGAIYAKVETQLKHEAEELLRQKEQMEKERQAVIARHNEQEKKNRPVLLLLRRLLHFGVITRHNEQEEKKRQKAKKKKAKQKIITKTYTGEQAKVTASFQADATKMAAQGYYPTSQTWAPGSYTCGEFLGALLLCFILIGFVVFIYMLIVKPDGTLSVTYELKSASSNSINDKVAAEKTCPQCAENVKAAALVCRFCNYKFQ